MQVDKLSGLLDVASQLVSPNCDQRCDENDINLIVIHGISLPPGEFGGDYIDQLFTNQLDPNAHPYFQDIHSLEVSSHLLIRRGGEITQYVPFHWRAWHAGKSCFQGRERCNDFSIGIELEGDDTTPYTDVQYQTLAEVIQCLLATYPGLSKERIVGHCDIAPGRKTDPGPHFEWSRLFDALSA